jgi:Uma2 family endonuclease
MHMAVDIRPWTRADLARLPDDGNRYEVLDGQLLVTPQAARAHQAVALELAVALRAYLAPFGTTTVVGPGAVPFGDNELQPDVQVIPAPPGTASWDELPPPVLVAEVLSDSTRRRDFGIKRDAYLNRAGVQQVWLVDWERREIHLCEVGVPDRVERTRIEWIAPGAPHSMVIDVPALFRAAIGEGREGGRDS